MRSADRHAEAAERFGEGLRLLAPYFQRLPEAFSPLCAGLLDDHIQSLLAAGGEPDRETLAPIVDILVERGVIERPYPAGEPPASP